MTPPAVDDDPWHGANPLDPTFRADPHPFLKHLREVAPVSPTPIGVWRLSRYEDCVRLLTQVPTGVRLSDGSFPGDNIFPQGGPAQFMLQQDPPNHTRLRKLVSKAFTPRAIERLRDRAQAVADEQIDRVVRSGSMDVIADLALPVPSTMICEMMGVPIADRDRFTQWTAEATHLLAFLLAPPEVLERGLAAGLALRTYFEALIEERRSNLRDDILSDLIRAEEAGDRLSEAELLSQTVGLLIAGFETTIGLIGNGVLALLRHPDQLARLRAEPGLIGSAVEECLRYDGPIPLTPRYLHADAQFGGHTIPKDTQVWSLLFAANRDPARFPDPDRFDIARADNAHLAFGGGGHFCLGAHLARMEAQVAIGTLVRRVDHIELASDDLQWGRSLFHVLDKLPVRFG
ncbi:MAG: cytochrome P450 [Candidatus Binatia bacterium]